jgi:hypothetical protein
MPCLQGIFFSDRTPSDFLRHIFLEFHILAWFLLGYRQINFEGESYENDDLVPAQCYSACLERF